MKEDKLSREQLIGWNDQVNVLFKNMAKTFKKQGSVVIGFDSNKDARMILKFAQVAHGQIKSLLLKDENPQRGQTLILEEKLNELMEEM